MAGSLDTPPGPPDIDDRSIGSSWRAGSAGDQAADPVSVRALVIRFALAGLLALVLVAVVTAYAAQSVGTDLAITDARRTTWITGVGVIEPVLHDALISGDPEALAVLDHDVREHLLTDALVRVKIWSSDGTVLYSDESRLIGQRFDLGDEETAMFASDGRTEADAAAEVSDLSRPENAFETESKLLEVYVPVQTHEGTTLLYEAYFRYASVTEVGGRLWRRFAPLAIGALLVLELIQVPFAWRLARRLRAGQEQREWLLQHAITSSDTERRRIAGDLHDGVVQELTGISMTLAATAKSSDPEIAQRLLGASGSIRNSVQSLRSLLVEIYPPNLDEEGLESALGDLLGGLANRGIAVRLDADPAVAELGPGTRALLYRVAQEALRNAVRHSRASEVAVTLRVHDRQVSLTVADDGVGFDPALLGDRPREGHVGLRALADLVADAGGRLVVQSEPGQGTRVHAHLERRSPK